MIELGSYAAYYSIRGFQNKTQAAVVKSLKNNYHRVSDFELEDGQIKAWENCYDVLHAVFAELPDSYRNLHVVFEYVLPQNKPGTKKGSTGKTVRADVLIISADTVLVLEFKQHDKPFAGLFEQAKKYQKRIERFHIQSKDMIVDSLLVLTKATDYLDEEEGVLGCSPDRLPEAIIEIMGETPKAFSNIERWLDSDFKEITKHHIAVKSHKYKRVYQFYVRNPSDACYLYCYNTQTKAFFYMDHCWTGMGEWVAREFPTSFSMIETSWKEALEIAKGHLSFPPDIGEKEYFGKFVEEAVVFHPIYGYGIIRQLEVAGKEHVLDVAFNDRNARFLFPDCAEKGSIQLAVKNISFA